MIRRKEITKDILPAVHTKAHAFAYRPYAATANSYSSLANEGAVLGIGDDEEDQAYTRGTAPPTTPSIHNSEYSSSVRIISRGNSGIATLAEQLADDRLRMAQLHAKAVRARVSEAKRLVDDQRYEYACDAVFECQRGFNFLGKANFSSKL
ncbi:hypothetical protein GGI12_002218 [Dipsacomyces acuminosporus]|nr:hypothetical protein GGI12_002218 [Dipsacomyces acuminosporus]